MIKLTERLMAIQSKLEMYKLQFETKKKEGKDVTTLNKRIKRQKEMLRRQKNRIKQAKTIQSNRMIRIKESLEKRKQRDIVAIEKMKIKINIQKETKDYNLTTSLKSYVDPRVYYEWGKQVEYDWKKYYSKSLQKKFSWLDCGINNKKTN